MQVCGTKQGDFYFVAGYPVVLLFVLFVPVKLFTQITLPLAVHLGFVAIDAKDAGNIIFVDLIIDQYAQLAETLQRKRKQQQYGYQFLQNFINCNGAKVLKRLYLLT